MKRDDWYSMGWSLGVHAVVLFLLSVMSTAASQQQPVGFLEVEFGAFAEASPAPKETTSKTETPQPPASDRQPVEEKVISESPGKTSELNLPDQIESNPQDEILPEPVKEEISPEDNPEQNERDPVQESEPETIRPLGTGAIDASDGDKSTDDGRSSEKASAAPYQIEGLNRAPVDTPLPVYSAQVNAVIRIRITVGPSGRIIRRIPVLKGDPQLERAVMDALLRWRFNPLPPDAPQENQTGSVTFRFRLR
jgi:periplasmic protein TonB